MRKSRPLHPLDHHPAFRAVVAAATPLATLATRINQLDLVATVALACSDLADAFAAPPDSRRRIRSIHRAWLGVKQLDRAITAAHRDRRAPAALLHRAQRAVDNADVLVAALLPDTAIAA